MKTYRCRKRTALPRTETVAELILDPAFKTIDEFKPEHANIEGYDPHPAIKAELAPAGGLVTDSWKDFTKKPPKSA